MARWRRKLLKFLLGLLGLVVIVVVLALLALANLDRRPMKGLVRGIVADQGIALDYDHGGVTLGGFRFAGLRISSPPQDAAAAPHLIKIGTIEGRWSPFSKRIDDLVIRDVALTVVRDADGTTSLDRWLAGFPASPPSTKPKQPADPLSTLAGSLIPEGVEAHARIEGVTVTIIDRAGPQRLTLTGLTVKADVANGGAAVALGPSPLHLAIVPEAAEAGGAARELQVDLRVAAKLPPGGKTASLSIAAGLVRQTLAPELPPVKQLLALEAAVEFDPAQRRTKLAIPKLSLLDGAATLTTESRIEDVELAGVPGLRPVVEQLALKVDLVALARAVPPELGPVEVEGEPIEVAIKDAAATPAPQGTLTALGDLTRARWRDITVRNVRLGADASPAGAGARGGLRLAIAELTMPDLVVRDVDTAFTAEHPPGSAPWPLQVTGTATVGAVETPAQKLRGVELSLRGTARSPSTFDGEVIAEIASVDAGAAVQGVHVELAARDLALGTPPLASAGTLRLTGKVAAARQPGGLSARALSFTANAMLTAGAPARAKLTLDGDHLVVPGLGAKLGRSFAGGPVHAEVELPAIELVVADPAASRGQARFAARYGGATVDGTANGTRDEVAYTLTVKAPRLGPSKDVAVSSAGTVRPADVQIAHDTQLAVGPTVTTSASLRGARVRIASRGTPRQHEATIAVAVEAPSSGGRTFRSAKLDITAAVDTVRGAANIHLKGSEPAADLRVVAALDGQRAIRWQLAGKLAGLAAAAVVLPPGPDWSRLAIELDGRGVAAGIVARVVNGVPVLVADPATALRGKQALTVKVRDIHYQDAELTRADIGAATLTADVDLGATRKAVVALDVPDLAAVTKGVKLGAKALAVRLEATLGAHGVARGIDARLTVRASSASQSVAPWYAIAEPAIEVTVAGDPDATLAIAMKLANPGAGTAFDLAGDLERGQLTSTAGIVARNSLQLTGKLEQALDRLNGATDKLTARGTIRVPFRIESGDLTVFRTTAQVALAGVGIEVPAQKLRVVNMNGEIPIIQEIVVGPDGVSRVGQGEQGPFSQLRFPDYRPFAGDGDYLSIAELVVGEHRFGPVAGNARVDHDVVAIDQLELAALGGKITGQALAELRGLDTRVVFRGKLTGLRAPVPGEPSSSGDPFDANVAIALTPYRYGLEGRAEIVRLSRPHLRALLDVWDPYRADVSANRVRLALLAGFPKQVRLAFASGFASAAVELGGLAGVVRIDELRGLPIGPALSHYLAPILEP